MALDVYVGSLTRYYAGEWENVSERTARERGTQFRIGRRVGADEPDSDIQEILQAILTWRVELNQSLGDRIASPLDWSEVADADPADFTLATMPARYADIGDRHAAIDDEAFSLDRLIELSQRQERDGQGDAPWPPQYAKAPGEPTRAPPSRRKPSAKRKVW